MPPKIKPHIVLIEKIKEELKFLKTFTESIEKESLPLLNLINSEKSKLLINNSKNLKKIGLTDGLNIQAFLDLFKDAKNQHLLKKQLIEIKENFEKSNLKEKNKIIDGFEKDSKLESQIKYIYLRILFRKDFIINLIKFKQLIDLSTNEENKKIIVDQLQKKIEDMGLKSSINFNNLNTLSDWGQEFQEIKQKLPTAKVTFVKKTQPTSSNISITPSEENSSENGSENYNRTLQSTTTSDGTIAQDSEFLPSWKAFAEQVEHSAKQNEHINYLEKDLENIIKERNKLSEEKASLEYLLDISKKAYEDQLSLNHARDSVRTILFKSKISSDTKLLKENQSLEEDNQKTKKALNELQSEYNAQSESLETLDTELESIKKLLEEARTNLSQKETHLEEISVQLKEAKEAVSELKSLPSDLDFANKELNQLNGKQIDLESGIDDLKNQNQKLKTELQENLDQKTALENDKSTNEKILAQHILEIKKLNKKIESNSNLMEDKESEINDLDKKLIETQKKSKQLENRNRELEEKIRSLQAEINQNDSANKEQISALETQLEALEEENKNIAQLEKEKYQYEQSLTLLNKDLENLNITLERTREDSEKIKTELEQGNANLALSQENAHALFDENRQLKNNHEEFQQNHSDLQKEYDTLEENLKAKTEEIKDLKTTTDQTQQQLETSKKDVENLNKEIKTIKNNAQSLEKKLQEFKLKEKSNMPTQDAPIDEPLIGLTSPSDNNKNTDGISPTPSDSSSSSSLTSFFNSSQNFHDLQSIFRPNSTSPTEDIPPDSGFSDSTSPSSSNSSSLEQPQILSNSIEYNYKPDDLARNKDFLSNDLINSDNHKHTEEEESINGTPMPPLEQQIDNLLLDPNFKESLKNALAARLKADYATACKTELKYLDVDINLIVSPQSEVNKRNQLIGTAVTNLFEDDTKKEIKAVLTQIVLQSEEVNTLSPENTARIFLDLFKLNTSADVPEEYKNCRNIIVKTLNRNKDYAKEYVALLKLCEEEILNTEAKNAASNDIITGLENRLIAINVSPSDYNEQIINTASRLVDEILTPTNVLEALEKARLNNPGSSTLIDDTKKILGKQYDKEIKAIIEANFAHNYIDRILEKINNDEDLSADEIQKLPSELQYADTAEEFVTGLRVNYPKLSSNYESKIKDEIFKKSRLLLRKNALSAIKKTLSDNDISDLTSELWLEKQLQLLTGKLTKLEHIELEKDQKNLLNELDSALHLSTFYDIALTPKSITELKADLEKLSHAQLAAAGQANKLFAEIENRLKNRPNLIDNKEIPGFTANLNQHLENNSILLKIEGEQAKILLEGINRRLKKDITKWNLHSNFLQKEITNDILHLEPNNFNFDKIDTEKLVTHALSVLYKNYANDTLKKRKNWLKDIALFYASTKKLSTFNTEIANRKVKIENLSELKVKKDEEVQTTTKDLSAAYAGIFLPHNCTIIADSLDPNLKITANFEFKILADIFYASNAMEVGQTITFESKLSDRSGSKEWSVTRDATGFAYSVMSSWVDKLKNIGGRIRNKIDPFTSSQLSAKDKEVTFAAFQHAIASSKAPVQTLIFGANCPELVKTYMYSLVENFNQEQRKNGQATTIFINNNDNRKKNTDDNIDKAHSFAENLVAQTKQTDEILQPHLTRPAGR